MHYRIGAPGTFGGMKPFELVRGLMLRADLGPLPLAKKLNKPKLQPQIHRFINGDVAEPRHSLGEFGHYQRHLLIHRNSLPPSRRRAKFRTHYAMMH